MIPIGDNRKRDKERTKEKRIGIGPAGREGHKAVDECRRFRRNLAEAEGISGAHCRCAVNISGKKTVF